eukprot:COSAG01_NODE_1159_length_11469_cov_15.000352_5_plen_68_part_00
MEDRVESLRRGSVARTAPEGSAPGPVLAPQPMPGALGGAGAFTRTGHLTGFPVPPLWSSTNSVPRTE